MREHTHMQGQKHKKTKCLINFDSLAHTTVFAAMLGRTRTQMKRGKNFFGKIDLLAFEAGLVVHSLEVFLEVVHPVCTRYCDLPDARDE